MTSVTELIIERPSSKESDGALLAVVSFSSAPWRYIETRAIRCETWDESRLHYRSLVTLGPSSDKELNHLYSSGSVAKWQTLSSKEIVLVSAIDFV